MQTDPQVADAIRGVARASEEGDADLLREYITHALSGKILHAVAAQPAFREHLVCFAEKTRGRDDHSVLAVLAELGRLQNYLRPNDNWPVRLATPLLTCDFEPSATYGSADQRLHIAQIVAASDADVAFTKIAQAAVDEKTAEKVRSVWIQTLVTRQPLSAALEQLTMAMRSTEDKAIRSAESWLRRLQRVFACLEGQIDAGLMELDEELSGSLGRFVATALSRSSPPRDYDASSASVTALLDFAHHLVQLRVRLGIDASFYAALVGAKAWFPEGGWIRFTRNSSTLERLRRTLLDGLLLLLEQGKPDMELLAVHRSLSPSIDAAKTELNELERESRHLSSELRHWLRSSGRRRPRAKDVELRQTDDLAIAFALIKVWEVDRLVAVDLEALLRELDITTPVQASALRRFTKDTIELFDRVRTLGKRRGLRLFGACGDIVEFSPHAYKFAGKSGLTRRVRVMSPGVEQVAEHTSRVLVQALVEPAEDA